MKIARLHLTSDDARTENGANYTVSWDAVQSGDSSVFDAGSPTVIVPPTGATKGFIRASVEATIDSGSDGVVRLVLLKDGTVDVTAGDNYGRYVGDLVRGGVISSELDLTTDDEYSLRVLVTGAGSGWDLLATPRTFLELEYR